MSLEKFIKDIDKIYGERSAILLSDDGAIDIETIPTGIRIIDEAIGVGGIPKGKITEVWGKEGSGKTSLCLHTIAEAQKMGMKAGFIDAEHALNRERAEALGVQLDKVVLSQPMSGEEALEIVEAMIRSGEFGLVVVDSVAALTPQTEIDRDMGESSMGVHARLMSQAMRKLAAPVSRYGVALLFTNQTRAKIGGYGASLTTTGGNALKFYASLRLKMQYIGKVVDSDGNQIAGKFRLEVVKNKLAIPYKKVEFEIDEGGINEWGAVLKKLIDEGKVEKAGSWYRANGTPFAQGERAAIASIREDESLRKELNL